MIATKREYIPQSEGIIDPCFHHSVSANPLEEENGLSVTVPLGDDSLAEGKFDPDQTKYAQLVKNIEIMVLRYLARRDYSRLELYQRLIAKGYQSSDIETVLDQLQHQGYQSDERFAEAFIRSKLRLGDGPLKIKIALRGKGLCDSLILAAIDALNIDWFERAKQVQEKRFGPQNEPLDVTELSKQLRYLKCKGFYQEHISAVLDQR